MQKLFAIAIVSLFALAALPAGEAAGTQVTTYVTARSGAQAAGETVYPGASIWCAAGGHNYAPIGDVEDYESPDGWAFSGEPECLAGDVISGDGDSGINAAAYDIRPEEFGEQMTVTIDDENFDATLTYFVGPESGDIEASGCGSMVFDIPDTLDPHWQSSIDDPRYILWIRVVAVHLDGDTLESCFGSTGTATAVWG